MKLKALLVLGLVLGCVSLTSTVNAQPVKRFNTITYAYYGWPNLMTLLFRGVVNNIPEASGVRVGGVGPVGNHTQFMVSNHVGLGLDFCFGRTSLAYTETTTDSLGQTRTYDYELINNRPRILARIDVHMGNAKAVDPYFAFGLGYLGSSIKFNTNDPAFDYEDYDINQLALKLPFIAYRAAFGLKVYFVKFMGAGFEMGLGGPLVTFGLVGKF
jgi:hypothetical protein